VIADMTDQVVLVTGASQGLGEIIAIEFARNNADVVVHYNSQPQKAEDVVRRINETGREALAVRCNIADSEQVRRMVSQALDHFGRIDVLVNNAAVNPKDPKGKTPIYRISDEEWDLVIDVNLKGTFNCTREVLKVMLEQKRGSIVNIASASGQTGNGAPPGAPYNVSKAGIMCLTKCAALDVASQGIRVNTVAPGPIEGPTSLRNPPEVNRAMAEKIPLKRIGKREEVAYAVVFLASDLSSNTTGETFNINGGWYMP
jgi:3-oxoacyl-[acyl-carrier protein] reductase